MRTILFTPRPATSRSCGATESVHVLRAGQPLEREAIAAVRRAAMLEGCKWDPQVGDVAVLSPFPLVMKARVWRELAALAEQLAQESIAAEEEISERPELIKRLGLPPALRQVLAEKALVTPAAGRVTRFDFHWTREGWRISEANSDVPGGFCEGSFFTAGMAARFPGLRPAGDPAGLWCDTLADAAAPGGVIALLSAAGYMEDHQVIAFLAARLRERGARPHLAKPEQIVWRDGMAFLETMWHRGPVNCIVKFYQAEWLSRLPAKTNWRSLFRGGRTPVANPPLAVISESKRFPLCWDDLSTKLKTWRTLLPETRDPRDVPWRADDGWLLKSALCNNGDKVRIRGRLKRKDWWRTLLDAWCFPGNWVAQRRFESVPVSTPHGPRHVCVGVFIIDGRVGGAYARFSENPLIDFAANDAALLIEEDDAE